MKFARLLSLSLSIPTALLLALSVLPAHAVADETALWKALTEGRHLVLIRHALAPGTGDPATFEIGDCSTQRNLSEEGRDQARAIGERFRANGIAEAAVFTSQWCRCRETARLLDLGPPRDLPPLNSFYSDRSRRAPQMEALRAWLSMHAFDRPTVLVTHQVVISALAGRFTRSGEMVVVEVANDDTGDVSVLGTIETR